MGGFSRDVAVIGGCGHVGLPLALTFADAGLKTVVHDINRAAVETVRSGTMPSWRGWATSRGRASAR